MGEEGRRERWRVKGCGFGIRALTRVHPHTPSRMHAPCILLRGCRRLKSSLPSDRCTLVRCTGGGCAACGRLLDARKKCWAPSKRAREEKKRRQRRRVNTSWPSRACLPMMTALFSRCTAKHCCVRNADASNETLIVAALHAKQQHASKQAAATALFLFVFFLPEILAAT